MPSCPPTVQVDPEGVLRTVIYTGLFSHALYREASALELYNIVGQGLLLGIQGLYYGDRTNHSGPVFQPTLDNVELILQPAVPYPATLDNSSAFSYFTGSWGINMLQDSNLSVTCFFNNFTSQGKLLFFFLSHQLPCSALVFFRTRTEFCCVYIQIWYTYHSPQSVLITSLDLAPLESIQHLAMPPTLPGLY